MGATCPLDHQFRENKVLEQPIGCYCDVGDESPQPELHTQWSDLSYEEYGLPGDYRWYI